MKVLIICVGRLKGDAEQSLVQRYLERYAQMGKALGLGKPSVIELAESKAPSARERKAAEAAQLRRQMPPDTPFFALDENGELLSSAAFSQRIAATRDSGTRTLAMVIGGPDGLDSELAADAACCLAIGRMTMPHGLVRAVLAEQLYRAATILAGHPYHRD